MHNQSVVNCCTGLLGLIENPDSFLKELIASVAGSN